MSITIEEILSQKYLVSIVILNWNQIDVTCEFLESARNLNYKNFEILVCDMGSEQDPTTHINLAKYPNTKVLRNETNLGSTGGNNWGIRQTKGEFIFVVNNDTEMTPSLIEELLNPFTKDDAIGVTCPKIKFYHQPELIQYAGFNPINVFTGRTTAVGSLQKDTGQFDIPRTTNGAHGCAMMIKKNVIDEVGMYPESFFIYYEEWDWSSRILKAGYKIFYEPKGVIFHKESVTMGKKSAIKTYYLTRNRILYMRRNTTLYEFTIFLMFFIFITAPKEIIKFTMKKQKEHLLAFLKGSIWNLTNSKECKIR